MAWLFRTKSDLIMGCVYMYTNCVFWLLGYKLHHICSFVLLCIRPDTIIYDAIGTAENVLISEVSPVERVVLYPTLSSWDPRRCPD